GSGAASLTLGGASLTVAEFVAAGGGTTALYAAGSGLTVTVALGPVSGTLSGGSFTYNPSAVTNWAFAGIGAAQTAHYFNVHADTVTLTVSGLGAISASSLDITKQDGLAATDSNPAPGAGSLFKLTLRTSPVELGSGAASLTL